MFHKYNLKKQTSHTVVHDKVFISSYNREEAGSIFYYITLHYDFDYFRTTSSNSTDVFKLYIIVTHPWKNKISFRQKQQEIPRQKKILLILWQNTILTHFNLTSKYHVLASLWTVSRGQGQQFEYYCSISEHQHYHNQVFVAW